MTTLPPALILAACLLLGTHGARAQHVVDPKGGGTHLDLQNAIDQASPGDWIRVRGGAWEEIVVRKSLTLLGDPMPVLLAPFNGVGTGQQQPAPLRLAGTGKERLRLVDIRIEGRALGSGAWSTISAAIEAKNWGSLELVRCHVHAMEWWATTGLANGAPAIRSTGALEIQAVDSWLEASDSTSYGWVSPSNVSGAAAIDAPFADVVLVGSTALGGDAASFVVFGCASTNCPCPGIKHHGGTGVLAKQLHQYGGHLQGGLGGEAWCWQGTSFERRGQQPSGKAYDVQYVHLAPQGLRTQLPPRPGGAWAIGYPLMPAGGLLLLGRRIPSAKRLGLDWLWVDFQRPVVFLPLPPNSVQQLIPVPPDPRLLALSLLGQTFDLGTWRLGSPLLEVVGF